MRRMLAAASVAAVMPAVAACGGSDKSASSHSTTPTTAARPGTSGPSQPTLAVAPLKSCVHAAGLSVDSRTITQPAKGVEITVSSPDRIKSAILFDVYPSSAVAQRNLSQLESTVSGLASDGTIPQSRVERTLNVLFAYATKTPPPLLAKLRSCLH